MASELLTRTGSGKVWRSLLSLLTVALTDLVALIPTFGVGQRGLVPAPSSGEVTALEFLNADGTFRPVNAVVATLESGSLAAAANTDMFEDSAGLWAQYRYLILKVAGASHNNANAGFGVRVSTDGSTFAATGYDGVTGAATRETIYLAGGSATNAAGVHEIAVQITGHQGGVNCFATSFAANGTSSSSSVMSYTASTSAIVGLRIYIAPAGVADAGTYTLVGIK